MLSGLCFFFKRLFSGFLKFLLPSIYLLSTQLNAVVKSSQFSAIGRLIIDPHNNQFPVGLLAQLVEHWAFQGSSPIQARIFQALSFAMAEVV